MQSVFSPPTLTSTPPAVPMGIVEQIIKEDDEDLELQESNSSSPPSRSTDSGASGESNKTITPPSSPARVIAVAAPTKKSGGLQAATRRTHARSESVPVNNIATQPLIIKKKTSNSGGGLTRSNSTTSANPLLRRRSSLMPPPAAAAATTREVKDVKETSVAKVGGARRVPMTADAPLLPSKTKQEITGTSRTTSGSKGVQRPQRPSVSGATSSVEPRTGPGIGPRNPSARVLSSAPKPRPLSLQLPSTFSVTTAVPPSVTKKRSSIIVPTTATAIGSSKLPQPQLRSKIPGPSVRSVSGLRKAT